AEDEVPGEVERRRDPGAVEELARREHLEIGRQAAAQRGDVRPAADVAPDRRLALAIGVRGEALRQAGQVAAGSFQVRKALTPVRIQESTPRRVVGSTAAMVAC